MSQVHTTSSDATVIGMDTYANYLESVERERAELRRLADDRDDLASALMLARLMAGGFATVALVAVAAFAWWAVSRA